MNPSISFLIATYNRANFLDKCIESILSQTSQDFEIIVVDDCSDDGTSELIRKKYAQRIIYHKHYINRGVAFARNVALDYASGEYLGLIDSDDILYNPRYIEIALGKFRENPNIDIFCCDNFCIDTDGEKISEQTFLQRSIDYKGIKLSSRIIGFDLMFFYGIHSSGTLIRKEIIKEIGFLNTNYKINWDEEFFIRVCVHRPKSIYFYNKPLTGYRTHTGNLSNNASCLYLERIKCRKEILQRNKAIKKQLGWRRINKRLAGLYLYLIDAYLKEGKPAKAFKAILKSLFLYPLIFLNLFKHGLNFSKRALGLKK